MITILVAYDDNRVIGYKNQIPWHIAEDLRLFKKRTLGYKILMGRRTWENLPHKPLPGRLNIVLTRQQFSGDRSEDGPVFTNDIVMICTEARVHHENLFIIGGSQVYELALKLGLVDNIIVSEVQGQHEGDAYFPTLPENRWNCRHLEKYDQFEILEYIKKD